MNANQATNAGVFLAVGNRFQRREFTQELRLESDFRSSPLNFTLGAFYEDGRIFDRVRFLRNTAYGFLSPTFNNGANLRREMGRRGAQAFGIRFPNSFDLTPFLPRPRVHSSTWSPEATITYTPNDDLTFFASYKKGYKSGSFAIAVPANAIRNAAGQVIGTNNPAFDDEKVEGYEAGIKVRLADRAITANLAWYDYRYRGLQVGGIEPNVGGSPIIRTVNAGRARTYGIDFDVAFRPGP